MPQRDYRKLRAETWDSSTFGKAAKRLYRTLYGKDPPNEPSKAKRRDPVPLYPCGVLEATYRSLREGPPCAFYERTQQEYRTSRGEKWSPSFISRFGKLTSKLYRALYHEEPPQMVASDDDLHDLVNVYPCGLLEQTYANLKAEGVEIGKPYREPDPLLRPEPNKSAKPDKIDRVPPRQRAHMLAVRESFLHGKRTPPKGVIADDDDGLI